MQGVHSSCCARLKRRRFMANSPKQKNPAKTTSFWLNQQNPQKFSFSKEGEEGEDEIEEDEAPQSCRSVKRSKMRRRKRKRRRRKRKRRRRNRRRTQESNQGLSLSGSISLRLGFFSCRSGGLTIGIKIGFCNWLWSSCFGYVLELC